MTDRLLHSSLETADEVIDRHIADGQSGQLTDEEKAAGARAWAIREARATGDTDAVRALEQAPEAVAVRRRKKVMDRLMRGSKAGVPKLMRRRLKRAVSQTRKHQRGEPVINPRRQAKRELHEAVARIIGPVNWKAANKWLQRHVNKDGTVRQEWRGRKG